MTQEERSKATETVWNFQPDLKRWKPNGPIHILRNITAEHAYSLQAKYGGKVWRNNDNAA